MPAKYKVCSFGQDRLGNAAGYAVEFYGYHYILSKGWAYRRVFDRFIANIYEPGSHMAAYKQARMTASVMNVAAQMRGYRRG